MIQLITIGKHSINNAKTIHIGQIQIEEEDKKLNKWYRIQSMRIRSCVRWER